jgi:hypothetical protein
MILLKAKNENCKVPIITDIITRKERFYCSVTGLNTTDISASIINECLRVYNITATFVFLTAVSSGKQFAILELNKIQKCKTCSSDAKNLNAQFNYNHTNCNHTDIQLTTTTTIANIT